MKDISEPSPVRNRPPSRRRSETRRVVFAADGFERRFFISIGYSGPLSLQPIEVFLDSGFKSGTDLAWLISDAAIVVSLLLQHGVQPEEIRQDLAIKENQAGSILQALIEELEKPPIWAEHASDHPDFLR